LKKEAIDKVKEMLKDPVLFDIKNISKCGELLGEWAGHLILHYDS
jgi:hypothetical protein